MSENIKNDVMMTKFDIRREQRREKRFKRRCKRILLNGKEKERKRKLLTIKKSFDTPFHSKQKKKITTTKFIVAYIFLNCTIIEVYSMYVMFVLQDLSALYSLITAVVTESLSFAVYAAKSFMETKEEEKNKLSRELEGITSDITETLSDDDEDNTVDDTIDSSEDGTTIDNIDYVDVPQQLDQ